MIDEGIRGNSSIAFGLPPISGVLQSRTPRDSRKIPQEDKSSPYYSSNNRQRLVEQVSSRGRGSGFVPGSIGAKLFRISERARVQQTRGRFFSYIGLLCHPSPRFGGEFEWEMENDSATSVLFFFLPHFSHYTPHVLPRSSASLCMHYSLKMCVVSTRILFLLALYSRNFLPRRGFEKVRSEKMIEE